jgi:hypothetical protein
MTLRLEIKPEIAASLNAQAKARGIQLQAYLQNAIEELARADVSPRKAPDVQEFRTALDQLAEMGRNLPPMPSSAFRRESIYQDHD